jgi:hypothetical protein
MEGSGQTDICLKYCGTAEKPSDQKRKQTSTYGIGKSRLFGSSYHLFCLSSGERTKMEVDIKGYPRVHTHYLSIKKDLDRLNKLLDQTRIQYQNALNKAQLYTLPIHELKKGVKLGDTFG